MSTVGLTGAVDLKKEEGIDVESKVLNFGIIIENGVFPFNRTKIIKIVPRYIIFNNLKDPIVIKQRNNKAQHIIMP
jgi:hypothetical protein